LGILLQIPTRLKNEGRPTETRRPAARRAKGKGAAHRSIFSPLNDGSYITTILIVSGFIVCVAHPLAKSVKPIESDLESVSNRFGLRTN
jgi:hypothetical protein